MSKLTESAIETFAINLFERLGYDSVYAPDIAPDGESPERSSYDDVLLSERLSSAVRRINPTIPAFAQQQAVKEIARIHSPDTLANNETFHRMLTGGVKVNYQKDDQDRGDLVWLIDFADPDNNEFVVANQFTVIENHQIKRPDIVLFVNGLPLVVIELKNPADENATVKTAYQQLDTYKHTIPGLFTYNALLVISDGLEAKACSLSAGLSRFMTWKSADGKAETSHLVSQLETLINGMLNKSTLLDLIRHFTVFEKSRKEDPQTGVISISTIKKVAAYHQYYAVNAAVTSTLRAASTADPMFVHEAPESYGVPGVKIQPKGDRKAGVVWHTQGSGKSLSMVFYTGKIVLALDNPTVLVITDRNDLDDQLFDTFAASSQLLRQEPKQVENRQQLKDLLKVASGGVIFSTIQKFQPEDGNVYGGLSSRRNIVVIADEAHRIQYGFQAKTIDEKDAQGEVIGKKVVYGFAKYLRDALPNATYLGFTGTPIEKTDVNTPAVFGNYVDIYDIAQAVEDGATVRIFYESRLAKVGLSDEGKKLIAELDEELDEETRLIASLPDETQKAKSKWTQMEALVGSEQRIKNIAKDIVSHFEARQEVFAGKGMIVSMSRRIAVELYNEIIKLKPEWHSDDLSKGVIKVVTALSQAFAIAIPHEQAMDAKDEVAFFQAVKARLAKFDGTGSGKTNEEIETTIRQVIDKALVSEQVIDVFDAAGIKKPDISILSKEIVESDTQAKKLGLTDFEYAFYTAVASNDSAKELMQHDQLRELAVVLTQKVRENASIDWTIKESVRAKLKVIVKRLLRQYGYPPDMQLLATETVLKQAEMIANELASK